MNDYVDGYDEPNPGFASELSLSGGSDGRVTSADCPVCCSDDIADPESGVLQMPARSVESDRKGGDSLLIECLVCGTQFSRREFFDPGGWDGRPR